MQNHLNLFSSLPTLRTKRLTLRPARMSDAADLYEYSKDPEVARHVLWDAHTSIHQTRSYLRFLIRQYRAGQPSTFVIVWNENRKAIGTIGFMWVQTDNCSAEVGYSLSRDYWNNGIMTEALREVIRYGFLGLRLNRIEAQHETGNPASGAVMRKCGMAKEGTLRQRLFNKGKYVDVDMYSILRGDFDQING